MTTQVSIPQTSTNSVVTGATFGYEAIAPLDEIAFAPIDSSTTLSRAVIAPYGKESAGLASYGGLVDAGPARPLYSYHLRVDIPGRLVRAARRFNLPADLDDLQFLPGRWIYGGELMDHFGHAMSESTHRAYPLSSYFSDRFSVAPFDGIIFSGRNKLKGFTRELFFQYYGIPESSVRIVNTVPVMVEELVLFPQGSILGGSSTRPEYTDLLQHYQNKNLNELRKNGDPSPGQKLFVSRRHLADDGGGQMTNEEELFNYVSKMGFVDFRPEELSLRQQLKALSEADEIIGVGGSFVHLFDHLGKVSARLFLLSRADRDSIYHPRSAQSKVSEFAYFEPSENAGDSSNRTTASGRDSSTVTYNQERLFSTLSDWLK